MSDNKLNVGLVGYGYSGKTFHAPLISAAENLRLTKIVSSRPDEVKEDWPSVKVVPSLAFLLEDSSIDLVVIATPNVTHYPFARQAILAGKHVVMEKPFTNTSEQAQLLISLAEENRVSLSVFHNRRWDADFLTIKDILEVNTLGRISHYEAHFDRFRPFLRDRWKEQELPGSGILYDLGSHLIDQSICLFGPPQTIMADLGKQRMRAKTTDYFHLILGYREMRVILHASNLVKKRPFRYLIHGERGSFIKDGFDPQEKALKAGIPPSDSDWGRESEEAYGTLNYLVGEQSREEHVPSLPGDYPAFYRDLSTAILNREEPPVSAQQALTVIRIIEDCITSHQERRTVDFIT